MGKPFNFGEFKKKLDDIHAWPSLYTFKFIVPKERVPEVDALFPKHEVAHTPSSKGTYVSVTARMMASSSEEVITIYKEASGIEGIISL